MTNAPDASEMNKMSNDAVSCSCGLLYVGVVWPVMPRLKLSGWADKSTSVLSTCTGTTTAAANTMTRLKRAR